MLVKEPAIAVNTLWRGRIRIKIDILCITNIISSLREFNVSGGALPVLTEFV